MEGVISESVDGFVAGIHELQKKEHYRLEYWQRAVGLHWWNPQYSADDFTVLQQRYVL